MSLQENASLTKCFVILLMIVTERKGYVEGMLAFTQGNALLFPSPIRKNKNILVLDFFPVEEKIKNDIRNQKERDYIV